VSGGFFLCAGEYLRLVVFLCKLFHYEYKDFLQNQNPKTKTGLLFSYYYFWDELTSFLGYFSIFWHDLTQDKSFLPSHLSDRSTRIKASVDI